MNKELIKLISENPDLPIFAWVDGEVCEDSCGYWAGRFRGNGEVREYVGLDYSYSCMVDCEWLFKDDTEDWEEYMFNEVYEDLPQEDAKEKVQEELKNMKWKKAIFVYVDTL